MRLAIVKTPTAFYSAFNSLTNNRVLGPVKGMTTQLKRRGRKEKPHQRPDGTYVNGLRKRPDGRWVIIATGKMFTEPNEEKAIEKFYQLQPSSEPAVAVIKRLSGDAIHFNDKKQMWHYFADELQANPKRVAELTGLPTLQWFKSYHAPEDLPTLKEIKANWKTHAKCASGQVKKVTRAWEDFEKTTGIKGVDEITAAIAVKFQDDVHGRGLAGKQQQHIFTGIRRMLSFARSRAMAVDAMTKALGYLKLMAPSESTKNIDPQPISVADWKALLEVATGEDRAMLLMMLNAALYAGEVTRVAWDEIKDNTFVSRRKKKGEFIRCATLWPETVEALNALDRSGPNVFTALGGRSKGNRLKKDGAFNRFRALRKAAKLPNVQASHLRDGAYSAAVAANITLPLCQLLAGHATGMSDNYVLGSPEMVAPACEAVRKKYMS
jgi:integrase